MLANKPELVDCTCCNDLQPEAPIGSVDARVEILLFT